MSILTEMCNAAERIVIVGHIHPDGDCIGSCLAVYNYLAELNPDQELAIYLEKLPEKFSYMRHAEKISQDTDCDRQYDLCICLDCADLQRLGDYAVYFRQAKRTLCIDHHITNWGFAEHNVIEPQASSTCEVLYDLFEEAAISQAAAECLYTGILHDTNVFKNSNTTGKTMMIAGKMMDKGINFSRIIDESFYQKTYVQNQIMGRTVLESILLLDGACIFSAIRKSELKFYGVDGSDLDGIVDQLRVTAGVECAILIYETDNQQYKVSMRSNQIVDVSKIAAYFDGGGHIRAAGCNMSGSPHDVINNLASHIEAQLVAYRSKGGN